MSYTQEQLREWAAQLAHTNRSELHTAYGSVVPVEKIIRAHADALDEIESLKAKLKVAEEALASIKQAISDPANQPSQFGTVPLSMYEALQMAQDQTDDKLAETRRELEVALAWAPSAVARKVRDSLCDTNGQRHAKLRGHAETMHDDLASILGLLAGSLGTPLTAFRETLAAYRRDFPKEAK